MIGSEGTLGVISKLTLKLIPAQKKLSTWLLPYENLDECILTIT